MFMQRGRVVITVVLAAMLGGVASASTISEAGFTETLVLQSSNIGNPTVLAFPPDGSGRIFVARKNGQVRVIRNGALTANPWATMSPITTASECGLLGLCFDPNFLANRYVYLFVTVSTTEQQILRYVDDPATDTGSGRTVLIAGLPTIGQNHDGGCVQIGPDGKIYWAIGNTNNAAPVRGENGDTTVLHSKVGRANLDGTAPLNNPFYDGTGPNNEFIYARGLRNPFKLYFQPGTGKLWVNCVGEGYEQVFAMNPGDDAGDRQRENVQGAGLIPPQIKYRTNSVATDTKTIAANGAARNNNVVTFTTTAIHGYRKGERLTISGVGDTSFNGTFFVASTPSTMMFTVAQAGVNATSGGGTSVPLQIGAGNSAAIVGGCFYDGTLFPAAYRGNLFFGDYSSGRIIRSVLDPDNTIRSVDSFATGANLFIDVTVGPDGALYYATHNSSGQIFRIAPTGLTQGVVLSSQNVRVMEGGSALVGVSLAIAPATTVQVTVQRASGDTDIAPGSSTLTFTPANFAMPQYVTLTAAHDADVANDSAAVTFELSGFPIQAAQVSTVDDDAGTLVLSSTSIAFNEGQNGTFTVRLPTQPTSNVTVSIAKIGDSDLTLTSGTTLTFTNANWSMPQTVTVASAFDADTTNDTATLTLTGSGLNPATVSVTVTDTTANAPQFTTPPVTTAVVNVPYSYTAGALGTPAPTFSLSVNPAGMSINSTSGAITWTPGTTGQFAVTVVATNGVQPNATQSFTITVAVDQPPTATISKPVQDEIISGANTEFYGNGNDDVGTVKGEFYVDGVLRFTDFAPGDHYHIGGSHLLFDTTIFSNGPHTLKMIVYDGAGQSGSQEIGVVIRNVSVVQSASASGTVGTAFTYTVVASNEPTNFSATGLPAGLSIAATTGVISGTPQQSGTFTVTVNVTNIAGVSSGTVTLTVAPQPVPVVTGGSAAGEVGQAFGYQIFATNSPDTYGASGLPGGLSVAMGTGMISGTPTASGTFTVTLTATNSGGSGSAQLTLIIAPQPVPVVTGGSASGNFGEAFTYQIVATNSPETYGATGLPGGLSAAANTGVISGTPTASGTFTVTLTATNSGGSGSAQLTLTIAPPPVPVVTGGSASGGVGQAFTYQIAATNNPDTYGASGLPDGLSVAAGTGVISGTPTVSGTFTVTLTATNSGGSGSAQLTLTVAPAPVAPVVDGGSVSATMGVAFSYQIVASQSPSAYAAQGLPAGLSVDAGSGLISGAATQKGTFTVTLSATNAAGTGTATLTLTVLRNPATNRAPEFSSGIAVLPQPLHAGGLASLSVTVTDADDDTLDITWDFGDGTSGTGSALTHTYALSGTYQIIVTASDGLASTQATLSLPVYPAAGDADAIVVSAATVKVQFNGNVKRHSAVITGTVRGPVGYSPANAQVGAAFGAFARTDTLNKNGVSADRQFQLHLSRKKGETGVLKFTLKLDKDDMTALLPLFPNATILKPGQRIDVPMSLTLGGQTRMQLVRLNYTARAGRNGLGKRVAN